MRRAAASSVASIEELWTLPASLHRLVLATQEAGNVTGHITSPAAGLAKEVGDRPSPDVADGARLDGVARARHDDQPALRREPQLLPRPLERRREVVVAVHEQR